MIRASTYSSRAPASSLSPPLTSSFPFYSPSRPRTSTTSTTAHSHSPIHIPRACPQRELPSHILLSPFTIASTAPMDDQHQQQSVTFPYILDGTGMEMNIEKSPQEQQNHSPSQSQGGDQNQVQMSPSDSTSAVHSTSDALLYHPYAHPHHAPFSSGMHQDSPGAHLGQTQTLTLDPAQLRTPSIGPSRVLTRRQARLANHYFPDLPRNAQQHHQQQHHQFGEVRAFTPSP